MPASTTTRSGNPAKRAAAKKAPADRQKPLVVSNWVDEDDTELLEFPSGKVAKIERVQLTTLIAEGLLGDSLSAIASQAVETGQGMDTEAIKKMGEDPTKVAEALDAFDRIAVKCFVTPEVLYYRDDDGKTIPKSERQPGALYSDKIDINDKVFLFQVISGGSRDLQRFRQQLAESVARVSTS